MEKLQYLRLVTDNEETRLVVQLSGGGAAINIKDNETAPRTILLLRELADLLEQGIRQRETDQPK